MTLMQMIEQGAFLQIAGLCALFIAWIMMINNIGRAGKAAIQNAAAAPESSANARAADMPAITAAITAAVNEYRKNK